MLKIGFYLFSIFLNERIKGVWFTRHQNLLINLVNCYTNLCSAVHFHGNSFIVIVKHCFQVHFVCYQLYMYSFLCWMIFFFFSYPNSRYLHCMYIHVVLCMYVTLYFTYLIWKTAHWVDVQVSRGYTVGKISMFSTCICALHVTQVHVLYIRISYTCMCILYMYIIYIEYICTLCIHVYSKLSWLERINSFQVFIHVQVCLL